MALSFWDGPCPECEGTGFVNDDPCPNCDGSGMIGGVEDMPPLPDYVRHNVVGQKLRHVREQRRIGMQELADEFGWGVVRLCNIERGREYPTTDELVQIMGWIDGLDNNDTGNRLP